MELWQNLYIARVSMKLSKKHTKSSLNLLLQKILLFFLLLNELSLLQETSLKKLTNSRYLPKLKKV